MILSASRMNMWMSCPLQAQMKYHLNLPREQSGAATFGSIMHEILEYLNHHPDPSSELAFTQSKNLFLSWWADPESLNKTYAVDWWPQRTSYDTYRAKGLEVLDLVHRKLRFDSRTLLGTEIPFKVPFGEHFLTGRVDLLEVRRSGKGEDLLRIIDYKFGGKQPTKAELALDMQFTVYDWAVGCEEFWIGDGTPEFPGLRDGQVLMDRWFDTPHRAIWFHMRGPKEIDAGPREPADFNRMYRVASEIQRATDLEVFVPKVGVACETCDYVKECELEIPVELEVKSDDPHRWL